MARGYSPGAGIVERRGEVRKMSEVSIGAVGAAILAGLISLLSLIISKEQKTSEFRQAWIDALRAELTAYLTQLNSISDALQADWESDSARIKAVAPMYGAINTANFGISLRLNPEERDAQGILQCMKSFEVIAGDPALLSSENIAPIEHDFLNYAKSLLKHEWKRVKDGELAFRVTKAVLIGLIILIPLGFSIPVLEKKRVEWASRQSSVSGQADSVKRVSCVK
jgi:hypothetical protein